jgi:hypothetical protein
MISLIASPNQIIDDEIIYITLTIDDELNQKQYEGVYINLIIKKVGTTDNIPTYQQRFNKEPLVWEISKYTYKTYGTFSVSANIYDGPEIARSTFVVVERCNINNRNICNNLNKNIQNLNSRSINFPKHIEPNMNTMKVQISGIDYNKSNIIQPISKITETPSINTTKVQRSGKNVNGSI